MENAEKEGGRWESSQMALKVLQITERVAWEERRGEEEERRGEKGMTEHSF